MTDQPTPQQIDVSTKLALVADAFNTTPAQLTHDLYTLCQWMQANKHYNLTVTYLNDTNVARPTDDQLPSYFLVEPTISEIFNDIIFYASYNKRSDFHGWGIKKNPRISNNHHPDTVWAWEVTWAEKFGYLHPEIQADITSRIDAIQSAQRAAPKRQHDNPYLEKLTTLQVAHRMAMADVMLHWMHAYKFNVSLRDDTYGWLQAIWGNQVTIMRQELEYRTTAEPEPRASKRKTEAARRDFRTAALWLSGSKQIYSDEFKRMAQKSAIPFDLTIDPEALPKQVPEKEPVMRMGYTQLIHEFMRWVTDAELDPDSFEYEDAILLKNKLREALEDTRKQLARAKGQHVSITEES